MTKVAKAHVRKFIFKYDENNVGGWTAQGHNGGGQLPVIVCHTGLYRVFGIDPSTKDTLEITVSEQPVTGGKELTLDPKGNGFTYTSQGMSHWSTLTAGAIRYVRRTRLSGKSIWARAEIVKPKPKVRASRMTFRYAPAWGYWYTGGSYGRGIHMCDRGMRALLGHSTDPDRAYTLSWARSEFAGSEAVAVAEYTVDVRGYPFATTQALTNYIRRRKLIGSKVWVAIAAAEEQ